MLARDLLTDTGSIFVQISDENVHLVRSILDEVFGPECFRAQIIVQKTGGLGSSGLKRVADYLLWYGKSEGQTIYKKLLHEKRAGEGEGTGKRYDQIERTDGSRRSLNDAERDGAIEAISTGRFFQLDNLTSGAFRENTTVDFQFRGRIFHPGSNACWKTTTAGLDRLNRASRIEVAEKTIRFVRYLDDFAAFEITNLWDDVAGAARKIYVVQTSDAVIERCLLMTTDPGDLVLDPTCGSGTTAYVAEQWGRALDHDRHQSRGADARPHAADGRAVRLLPPPDGRTVPRRRARLPGTASRRAPFTRRHSPWLRL